jgi:hypothetical protein
MIEIIVASVVLAGSFIGLLYFAVKKFPVLLTYPVQEKGNSPREIIQRTAALIQNSKVVRKVSSPDLLLQNVLSKTRIAALKTENKTGKILEGLRKKSQEENGNSKFSADYWKKLRKRKKV